MKRWILASILGAIGFMLSGCQDVDKVYAGTIEGFVSFLEVFNDVRLYPGQERPHLAMVAFLDKERDALVQGLSMIAQLRKNDPKRFWHLFEKNRTGIISVLRKIDAIDKRERLLLGAFTRVFSARENDLDQAKFSWDREMLQTWLAMLLKESRQAIR